MWAPNAMKILNLYAGIGGNRKLWGDEHEITAVEFEPYIAEAYNKMFPQDEVVIGDAHQYLLDHYHEFDFIWTSPPCPTHSRMRAYQKKRKAILKAKGICLNCQKVPAAPERTCCHRCLLVKMVNTRNRLGLEGKRWYLEQINKQKGLCAICQRPMTKINIDHCHKTNKLRGLLCTACNVGLGNFQDSIPTLKKAIEYLTT